MKVVILQSNYLPWKGYFDLINDADIFCFYDEVQYTKNDWRNRNRIYSKNGLQWLSIPISKTAVKGKISEAVLPKDWSLKHVNAIKMAYGRAPFFETLEKMLHEIYFFQHFMYLSEFNQNAIRIISAFLEINTNFVNSTDYELKGNRIERLVNILKDLGASEYISGPSARGYLSGHEHHFAENGIQLTFKNYAGYPEYQQLRPTFEHYVSIVDMIANLAKDEIKKYIWGWRNA